MGPLRRLRRGPPSPLRRSAQSPGALPCRGDGLREEDGVTAGRRWLGGRRRRLLGERCGGLVAVDICAGAKILAIVDAFEAVMLKHIHRGKNRSVLRAIAEINACDTQFAPEWINPFNQVIRKTLES